MTNKKILTTIIIVIIIATVMKSITADLDFLWTIMQGLIYAFYGFTGYIVYLTITNQLE